mmetsp:Transcript_11865/g.23387  ORF Transcript_11865/g.23387 Transcript_11865/m.23387 type:complete len:219 (+) Transcript_11865:385-1041(+)
MPSCVYGLPAAFMMAAAAARTCTLSVNLPVLNRHARAARVWSTPIALSTCEMWTSSAAWHADPAEKETEAWVAVMSTLLVGHSGGKETFRVLGRRSMGWPLRMMVGKASCSNACSSSLLARMLDRYPPMPSLHSLHAMPSATTCMVFSVPALLPPSWPAPCIQTPRVTPCLTYMAPTPAGAYSLCPATVRKSTPRSLTSIGTFPTDWEASVWTSTPFA